MAREYEAGICICYVYFRYSEATDVTVRQVLEVLVKQTLERHPICIPIADDVYDRHVQEGTHPTEQELLQLLAEFIQLFGATFYLLEALDEAPTNIQEDLVRALASLNIRLFITSRPIKAAEEYLQLPSTCAFQVVAQENDLDLLINAGIDSCAHLHSLLSSQQREEVANTIKEKCGDM